MVTIVLYQVIYFDVIVFIGRINMLNRQQLALLSPVHTGDKVEFNTRSTLLKVNKIDRVALAPYILATKSTELATMSTATSCRIQAVADLPRKPATKSTNRRQSTLLPICRRFRQQSTLSPCSVYRALANYRCDVVDSGISPHQQLDRVGVVALRSHVQRTETTARAH